MPSPSEALHEFSAIILTGGSSGIGKSFIELADKLHPSLIVCNLSRRIPDLKLKEIRLRHFTCDLSNPQDLALTVPEIEKTLAREAPDGRILLVNNSGFGGYSPFPEPGLDHQLGMIDVNVRAVVDLTGRLLPLLKARGGAILTVASTAAFQPTPWTATYGATKAFVLHWSLALNEELRGSGVRALAACPGPTPTEFYRRAGLRSGSVGGVWSQSPERVVWETLRALGSGRSLVVTGWKNKVMVWISSRLPKPWAARLARIVLARFRLSRVAHGS